MSAEKIYLWPRWFRDSAPTPIRLVPDKIIDKLGRANMYLWRALNFYDDVMDSQMSKKLPLANTYHRRYLEIYYRLGLAPAFYRIFNQINSELDKANYQELRQTKLQIVDGRISLPRYLPLFPKLTVLSRKSLALALGPVAILFLPKNSKHKKEVDITLTFFKYALAAKQLADDAQDWREDLNNGFITAANVLVLRAAKKQNRQLDLKRHPEIANLLFASAAADKLTLMIDKLCRLAKKELKKMDFKADCPLARGIIGPLEKGVTEAREFRRLWLKNS